jgi:hypothetical protein
LYFKSTSQTKCKIDHDFADCHYFGSLKILTKQLREEIGSTKNADLIKANLTEFANYMRINLCFCLIQMNANSCVWRSSPLTIRGLNRFQSSNLMCDEIGLATNETSDYCGYLNMLAFFIGSQFSICKVFRHIDNFGHSDPSRITKMNNIKDL